MLFSSLTFLLIFFPVALGIYFLTPVKFRNYALLLISITFYTWGEPKYIFLILASIFFNFLIGKYGPRKFSPKAILILSIGYNLAVLVFFKYSGLIISTFTDLLNIPLTFYSPALPIGISFFTFQLISYQVDLYQKKFTAEKNIVRFSLFVLLFPHLLAGPIVRYSDIRKELNKRSFNVNNVAIGIERFIIGLAKKILIANQLGALVKELMGKNLWEGSGYLSWIIIILFGLQIYFDFSGYSDMAIGLGRIFGFVFPENFNYPYISKSISEFWRRWHMSLGGWFRDYLYIPLGGNRKGSLVTVRNLAIVWLLTGLWHGASWNFVLWGLYFGVFICIEKSKIFKAISKNMPSFLLWIYSSIVIFAGWGLFYIENLARMSHFMLGLFVNNFAITDTVQRTLGYIFSEHLVLIIIAVIGSTPFAKMLFTKMKAEATKHHKFRDEIWLLPRYAALLLLFFINIYFLVNSSFNPFIYFRF